MEKIFDPEVENYLINAGVSLKEINKIKYESLKLYIIDVLKRVIDIVDKENFDLLKEYIFESPAGDGYGLDNNCIEFGGIMGKNDIDIYEAIEQLKSFK